MSHSPDRPRLGKLEIDGFKLDLDRHLGGDYEDIAEVVENLPPALEWLGSCLQAFLEHRAIANQAIKEAEARAFFALRGSDGKGGTFEARHGGKMTADALAHAVVLDDAVAEAHRNAAAASAWVSRVQETIKNFTHKLELIRSSEATRRRLFDVSPGT